MPRKQFDLIVFDWDGTLMDSTGTIVRCIQASARDLGLPVPDQRAASYVIGLGLQDAMEAVLPDLDPKFYPRMVERYRYHYLSQDQELVLFDGVSEMLADLAQQGYFLAVATGKSRVGLNRAGHDPAAVGIRRHPLRRRNLFQTPSRDAARTDPRTGPGSEAHGDDRRYHARPADGR